MDTTARRSKSGLAFQWAWRIGCCLVLLACASARAAVTLDISPRGYLPQNASVSVVITARFAPGASIEDFGIAYNGADVTKDFLKYAVVTRPDPGTIVASFDYLFPAGSHSLTARLKLALEVPVTASTTFQVPDTDQARMRNSMLNRLNEYLRQFDAYQFSRVISLGDIAAFTARANEPSFQIYVDPEYIGSRNIVAAYVEVHNFGLSYYRDLVLAFDPDLFSLTRAPQTSYSPFILWEEMVHAISHLASENNSPNRLPDPKGGASADSIDHFYIDWVEACIKTGLPPLVAFEQLIVRQGTGIPTDSALKSARAYWRAFVNGCNDSQDARGVPTTAQRAVLKNLVGFSLDVDTVRNRYLALGYPAAYFDAATVTIVSPGVSSTVTNSSVEVSAMVSLVQGTRVDKVGFLVNGAVQYASLAGDTFFATLPLNVGANTILAGMIPLARTGTTEAPVMSKPITVTRTVPTPVCPQITTWSNADQSLYAPLRVTRVDHGNSPGRFYFYILANPNDPQEKSILGTYFNLGAGPTLTRDQIFANNVGVSLVSFASGADANEVWRREIAAWDATPAGNRPDLLLRDATQLVWGWTAIDGGKHIEGLSLRQGSVIAYITAKSQAAGETVAQAGMNAMIQRAITTFGLIDVKCTGR